MAKAGEFDYLTPEVMADLVGLGKRAISIRPTRVIVWDDSPTQAPDMNLDMNVYVAEEVVEVAGSGLREPPTTPVHQSTSPVNPDAPRKRARSVMEAGATPSSSSEEELVKKKPKVEPVVRLEMDEEVVLPPPSSPSSDASEEGELPSPPPLTLAYSDTILTCL